MTKKYINICILILLYNCNAPKKTLFTLTTNNGINFINTVTNTEEFNIFNYRNFYNGGGCAIGDINNDGLADVYFTANQGSNKLYLNNTDTTNKERKLKFADITNNAGVGDSINWSTGVVMVDINHDNWLDIYVCNAGYINGKAPESKLYINNHNLTFTESAAEYGLQNKGGYATHAAFFDYDKDGDLDCFIINNSFIPTNTLNYENKRNVKAQDWPVKDFLKGGGDRLYKNENGKYTDVTAATGIYGSLISFGLGVTVGDINNDGWLDVYVSNDFFERDYVYINQKNGTFKDEYESYIQHSSHSSMGADMCDVNNDGLQDIFTTEMLPDKDDRVKTTTSFENIDVQRLKQKSGFGNQYMQNTLQINNGNNQFLETAYYSGVAASDWSWGALAFDADNDGLADLYVCNGVYKDVTNQDFIDFFADEVYQKMALSGKKAQIDELINKMPSLPLANKMYNNISNVQFTDKANDWGLATPSFSNGAAYGDLDNDGDLDIIVNNVNQPAFVYQNNSAVQLTNNYIAIQLKDTLSKNTYAIGSKVKVYTNNICITKELMPTRGFQSSVDYKLVIGLGTATIIDSMQIIWANSTYETLQKPQINKTLILNRSVNTIPYNYIQPQQQKFFTIVNTVFEKHIEDDYIDFYNERNIPSMQSREGPKATVADVNGDGLQDVFIAGASIQAAQLYLQSKNGTFIKSKQEDLNADAVFEDVAAQFADIDNDNDMDLIVGSGGNNNITNLSQYNTRIYVNNSKGIFAKQNNILPNGNANTSCIATNDYDKDGDVDVFIGSKSLPGNYGITPNNMLLQNDGKGNFENVISKFPNLQNVGLVTNALWSNIITGGSTNTDLLLVGEWMAPTIFTYNGKAFIEQQTNLQSLTGWWQTATTIDVNKDGKMDVLLGNIGKNFCLQPMPNNTLKLWMNDYDKNGTIDKIITKQIGRKDVPIFLKKDLTEQIPSLRKQNLKYSDYAFKTIQQLFTTQLIETSTIKTITETASYIAINEGNGSFTITELPWQTQLSCINSILTTDVNKDGYNDVLIGSNKYDLLPQFGRLDAAYGTLLINNKKGQLEYVPQSQFGTSILGCVRDIQPILNNGNTNYLWLLNNNSPVLLQPTKN